MNFGFHLSHRLELRPSLELEVKQRLKLEQKQELRQLLELELTLRHPEFPEAAKGLEGLKTADEVLRRHKAAGVLIGGLAEAIWNKKSTAEDLNKHKDVDVLVFKGGNEFQPVEGGIDWWLPKSQRLPVSRAGGTLEAECKWWQNFNQVALAFGVEPIKDLEPGLYLPDSNWVLAMRLAEIEAHIDQEVVEADTDVMDVLEEKLKKSKGLTNQLMSEIKNRFTKNVLAEEFGPDSTKNILKIRSFDLPELRAIHKITDQNEPAAYEPKPQVEIVGLNKDLKEGLFYESNNGLITVESIKKNLFDVINKKATVDSHQVEILVSGIVSFLERSKLADLHEQMKNSLPAERHALADKQIDLILAAVKKFGQEKLKPTNKDLFLSILA